MTVILHHLGFAADQFERQNTWPGKTRLLFLTRLVSILFGTPRLTFLLLDEVEPKRKVLSTFCTTITEIQIAQLQNRSFFLPQTEVT